MSRRGRTALIACGAIAFLVVSAILARWLSLENVERDDVITLLQAEARGDTGAMLAQLHGCSTSCRAAVAHDAAMLRGSGRVLILNSASATGYALTSTTGQTRVAWKLSGRLPSVQCVLVRRSGNAISGLHVSLMSIGAPIPLTSDC